MGTRILKLSKTSMKLSVVLATRNEHENIGRCLKAIQTIADEIIVVDESSTDDTREIARSYGAKVVKTSHEPIFHVTKQKAIDLATGDWILQLDADEVVTKSLAEEITHVISLSNEEILKRKNGNTQHAKLFRRHQRVLETRDGAIGTKTGEVVAFFIPRRNMFLGKPLIHAGVYPDAVIRLFKKGKAYLPAKSVHEQMVIEGEVAWLFHDLEHHDSPTLRRYLARLNRYTDLHAEELHAAHVKKGMPGLILYTTIKPVMKFLMLYVRHRGYMDGIRGFLWAFFSASHFPIAYYKYVTRGYNKEK